MELIFQMRMKLISFVYMKQVINFVAFEKFRTKKKIGEKGELYFSCFLFDELLIQ